MTTIDIAALKAEQLLLKAEFEKRQKAIEEAVSQRDKLDSRLRVISDLIRFAEMYTANEIPEEIEY